MNVDDKSCNGGFTVYDLLFISAILFIVSFWVAKLVAACFRASLKAWPSRKLQGILFFVLYLALLLIDAFINFNAIFAFLVFVSNFKTGLEDYYDGAALLFSFVYAILFFGWNMEIAYKKQISK